MTIKKESDMNQRDAFEKWAKKECCTGDKNGINFKRAKYNDGSELYEDESVETAWAAWQAATASQWQPIETAPKDGRTIILGYLNSHSKWRTMRGQWFTKECIDDNWEDGDLFYAGWYETSVEADEAPSCWPTNPTHWMPLPPEPAK